MSNLTYCHIVSFNLIRLVVCEKCPKQIFKMAAVAAILDFWSTDFSSFQYRSCPVATEQVSAQINQRFGKRCRKLIFKIVAVAASWIFIASVLAILCLLGTPILLIKFQFNWIIVFRGDVQNMTSTSFPNKCKKIFKGFYNIWAWRSSWPMDRNCFSNLSLSSPKEAPLETWATLAQRLQRRSCLKFSTFFPYKYMGTYKCIGKQTWPRCKTVERQCMTIILATLVDLQSLMICAKIQPQGILGSKEALKRFLSYMGMAAILVNWPQPF